MTKLTFAQAFKTELRNQFGPGRIASAASLLVIILGLAVVYMAGQEALAIAGGMFDGINS